MNQTHDKCKHYSHRKCPHIDGDVMKRANSETQPYYGVVQLMPPQPTDDEINKLCKKCKTFTPK